MAMKGVYDGWTSVRPMLAAPRQRSTTPPPSRRNAKASATIAGTRSKWLAACGCVSVSKKPVPARLSSRRASPRFAICTAASATPAVRRAEDRVAGRVREKERERDEDRREVEEHVGHVDSGEARDERIHGVPEREGVAGVEAAVLELVHAREAAQHVELRELPGAGRGERSRRR